jgi:hypothetical protein
MSIKRVGRAADELSMSPVHPAVALGTPIRSTRRVYSFALYAWLFGACMVALGVAVLLKFATREGPGSVVATFVFFGGLAASAGWYGARLGRAELRIDPRSVLVRNPLRSHVAALDQVEAFRAGNATPNASNPTPGIVVCLKDGQALPVWALAEESSIFSTKRRTAGFEPLADALNELLTSVRTQ